MVDETYEMTVRCENCGKVSTHLFAKGEKARAVECVTCGCNTANPMGLANQGVNHNTLSGAGLMAKTTY